MKAQLLSVHPHILSLHFRRFLLALVFLFTIHSIVVAETVLLGDADRVYDIYPYLEIANPVGLKPLQADQWESLSFSPLSTVTTDLEDRAWYYLRFQVENSAPLNTAFYEWVLKFPLVLTEVEYMLVNEQETLQTGRTGFFVPLADRDFVPSSKGNFARLSLPPGGNFTVYLRLRCDRYNLAPDLRFELSSATHFYELQKSKKLFNGVFVGFVVLLLLYNLFLFFLARDEAYIFYSLYLAALCLFTVYNTGDLWDWVLGWLQPQNPQLIAYFKLITYTAVIAYMAFLRSFLALDRLLPKWDRGFHWFSYLAVAMLLLDGILIYRSNYNYNTADVVTLGYFFVFLLLMLWFLIPLAKTRDSKRNFIIGGVLVMVLGILVTMLDRIRTVDFSTFYYKVATIVEVIIFSLGLAYRQREVEQEAQRAEFALEKAQLLQTQKEQEAEQLAALDAAKSRFYTHLTHELRTPLTVIKGLRDYLQKQLEEASLPEYIQTEWYNSLEIIGRNSDQLLTHINQLLELSKLESGSLPIHYQQGDVIAYLNYLTESFYSLAREREIRLLFYPECDELVMDYDESKLQQITYNLLSNALRHTPRGGKVVLHARKEEGEHLQNRLQLKVSDSGQGIAKEDLDRIFKLFYQVDDHQSGTGIGLTLTKELVELLEGEIQVESELDKGTTFTLLLPINNQAPVRKSPLSSNNLTVSNLEKTSPPEDKADAEIADHDQQEREVVLLVEDNADVLTFLIKLLGDKYELLTAVDGEEGLNAAQSEIPDLIISDVMMPKMDGFELCEKLKSDARTSHIPVIILTAKGTKADQLEGLRTGADAYLMKPFEAEELFLRMDNLFQMRERLQFFFSGNALLANGASSQKEKEVVQIESTFLQQLREIVKSQLDSPKLSTSYLAQEMSLSDSQLYRKLKALTNQSPSVFVRDQRLEYAAVLLKNPELHIAEVAYRCGFNDPNYFSRVFHRKYGQSPRDYRMK